MFIIQEVEKYVINLFELEFGDIYFYYNLVYILGVRDVCLEIGKGMGISKEELEVLELVVLFYDIGFVV